MTKMEKASLANAAPEAIYRPGVHTFVDIATPIGNLLFMAEESGPEPGNDFENLVKNIFNNIAGTLKSQGLGMESVSKYTILIAGFDETKGEILLNEFKKISADNRFPFIMLIPVLKLASYRILIAIELKEDLGL